MTWVKMAAPMALGLGATPMVRSEGLGLVPSLLWALLGGHGGWHWVWW